MSTEIDAVRAERQAKLDRKIDRMRAKADRLERDAAPKMAEFNRLRQDYAWLTQPANPNTGFGKQRQRTVDRYGVGLNMLAEAKELRERADALEKRPAVVKGDAERERQIIADALDTVIVKGSRITDFAFGEGTVTRVNKKTYTVCWDRSGNTWAREKTFVRPLDKAEHASAIEAAKAITRSN
jgi:hypothetical protein